MDLSVWTNLNVVVLASKSNIKSTILTIAQLGLMKYRFVNCSRLVFDLKMKTGTMVVLFTLFEILTLVSESNCLVLSLPPEGKVCEMSLTECISKICILKIFICKVVYTTCKAKIISSIIFHNFIIFKLLLTHIFPFSRFFLLLFLLRWRPELLLQFVNAFCDLNFGCRD